MAQRGKTNSKINNVGYVHFACSEEVIWPVRKNINRFVSVNCSVQIKRSWEPGIYLFMCLIDMNKFFEKHL